MSQPWRRGAVLWAELDPARGREQAGRRPVLVIASDGYLDVVETLTIIIPVTTVDRGWPNHVPLTGATGLAQASWAMTEQPRTIDRSRIAGVAGQVDGATLAAVDLWLRDFLGL